MANFECLRSCLSNVPFENAFSDDIVHYWSDWKDLFLTAVNKFVPVKTIKDINSPQWIDGKVRQLVRKKYAPLKKCRQNRSIIRKQKLRCISQNIKSLIRKKHREYLERVESPFNKNPKFSGAIIKLFYTIRNNTTRLLLTEILQPKLQQRKLNFLIHTSHLCLYHQNSPLTLTIT